MHFSQSKSTKCEFFGCLLSSPWQKMKKHQFEQRKGVWKGLKMCTYRFWGMQITMHYVTTLCDKYLLSYEGFSWFVTGRFRHSILKHGVGVEWDARWTAAYVPYHFNGSNPTPVWSGSQEQYYIRSPWHLVSLWVRLTFSQTYPQ